MAQPIDAEPAVAACAVHNILFSRAQEATAEAHRKFDHDCLGFSRDIRRTHRGRGGDKASDIVSTASSTHHYR